MQAVGEGSGGDARGGQGEGGAVEGGHQHVNSDLARVSSWKD